MQVVIYEAANMATPNKDVKMYVTSLDARKAFNGVSHHILKRKLYNAGLGQLSGS
jgi:hypothetical protein